MVLGSGIRDPRSGIRKNLFRIPDPGVKKATDPGSGSATLDCNIKMIIFRWAFKIHSRACKKERSLPGNSSCRIYHFQAILMELKGSYHKKNTLRYGYNVYVNYNQQRKTNRDLFFDEQNHTLWPIRYMFSPLFGQSTLTTLRAVWPFQSARERTRPTAPRPPSWLSQLQSWPRTTLAPLKLPKVSSCAAVCRGPTCGSEKTLLIVSVKVPHVAGL